MGESKVLRLCGGMYQGLSEVAGVMGGGLWCPLTPSPMGQLIEDFDNEP